MHTAQDYMVRLGWIIEPLNNIAKIDKLAKIVFSVFKENNVNQLGSEILGILSKVSS